MSPTDVRSDPRLGRTPESDARALAVFDRVQAGETMAAVAVDLGLSQSRIWQLYHKARKRRRAPPLAREMVEWNRDWRERIE